MVLKLFLGLGVAIEKSDKLLLDSVHPLFFLNAAFVILSAPEAEPPSDSLAVPYPIKSNIEPTGWPA